MITIKKIFLIFIVLIIFSSCPIENLGNQVKLAPPLGLTAINTNGAIFITFHGFNTENFFSGYNVYITTNLPDVINTNAYLVFNPNGVTNQPTIPASTVNSETLYSTYIASGLNLPAIINNGILQISNIYYIYVEAYSLQFNVNSEPCEYTGIMYLSNTN